MHAAVRVISALVLVGTLLLTTQASAQQRNYFSPVFVPPDQKDASDPPPTPAHPWSLGKRWLVAGTLCLAIPYGLSLTGAAGDDVMGGPKHENWLALPGFGPIVLMAETTAPAGNVVLGVDGLLQLGGVAMIVYGGILRAREGAAGGTDDSKLRFTVMPMTGAGRSGAMIVGTF
jgi:hypothetical protein